MSFPAIAMGGCHSLYVELLLAVEPPPELGVPFDLVVEIEPHETVSSLRWLLAGYCGFTDPNVLDTLVLIHQRTDSPLDPGAAVIATALTSGDTVVVRTAAQVAASNRGKGLSLGQPLVSVDVLSGPNAGLVVPLSAGSYAIGSADDCVVQIADVEVAPRHLVVKVSAKGDVTVGDGGERALSFVDGAPLVGERRFGFDELVVFGETALKFEPAEVERKRDRLGQIAFNRTPYHRVVVNKRSFDTLQTPPTLPTPNRFRMAMIAGPALMGLTMFALTGRVFSLAFVVISPVIALFTLYEDRKYGKGKYAIDLQAYRERVDRRVDDVRRALAAERSERLRANPDVVELAARARFRQPRLWERDHRHGDFLTLRAGLGLIESQIEVKTASSGDEDLLAESESLLAFHKSVAGVPVAIELAALGIVGVEGDLQRAEHVTGGLIVQAATLHSPEELVIAGMFGPEPGASFSWLKWLPHTRSPTSPLEGEHLVSGPQGASDLVGRLSAVLAARSARGNSARAEPFTPHVLLVVHDSAGPDPVNFARLVDASKGLGMSVLWVGEDTSALPRQCAAVLSVGASGRQGVLRYADPERSTVKLQVESATPELMLQVGRSLAAVRDASAGSVTTALPRRVPLLELLGLPAPQPEQMVRKWSAAESGHLAAPIGAAVNGPFVLDLVEDGPHGLIAGTSGAGKSELLQSLVASLAASHAPNRLNFLFVDYKGGAAVQDFYDLPHAVGFVTDLDAALSRRALISLRAELKRREHLLEGKAKDIVELERLFPEHVPPRLLIVIDEFATLAKELPDFVAGVVDVAQRGRSLGIHLILATQRPAGAVNDNILANTNLRIALRVLDAGDSSSVIGTREAADIPAPLKGRAYARTGPKDITPFQAAYSGAVWSPSRGGRSIGVSPFVFGVVSDFATFEVPGSSGSSVAEASTNNAEGLTDLQVLVAAIDKAADLIGQGHQPKPWLEPLPAVVEITSVLRDVGTGNDPGREVAIGRSDEPEHQTQPPTVVDLEQQGGLIVFGTGGSGKTTLLNTIAASVALTCTPDDVWMYVVDCGGRRLGPLERLAHVGAVVFGDELERVSRLISFLTDEVARRSELLAQAGVGSLSEYRNAEVASAEPLSRILVMFDNYQSFASTFDGLRLGMSPKRGPEWVEDVKRLVVDGRPVGVHFIFAAPTESGFPSIVSGAVSSVIRLRSGQEGSGFGRSAPGTAELRPGQGRMGENELQIGVLGGDASGSAQAKSLQSLADEQATLTRTAPLIRAMPRDLDLADLPATLDGMAGLHAVVGLGDRGLRPVAFDLELGHVVVAGPRRSGRTSLLATTCKALLRVQPDVHVVALGDLASTFAAYGATVITEPSSAVSLLSDLVNAGSSRVGPNTAPLAGNRVVVIVDDAETLTWPEVPDLLEQLARRVMPNGARVVCALELGLFRTSYTRPAFVSEVIKSSQGVLLGPDTGDGATLGAMSGFTEVRPGMVFGPGRGVLIRHGASEVGQFAQAAER